MKCNRIVTDNGDIFYGYQVPEPPDYKNGANGTTNDVFSCYNNRIYYRDTLGTIYRIHREDGPALIFRRGAEQWYTHGDITKGIPNRIQENGMEYWCGKTIYPSGISHAY